ncbi:C39 family peptidase [Paenibacillus polysaccharolyticus]|uniref:C39 family peptidase n=1 Tax=Paenibacillus TaxID=44249 RepID=UPI00209C9D7F|nr:C39 family peptidase [Paenibacillus polysaccharolyticus]MCP1132761.1 C39 family peptidase [Paenibacillus polysaccharolyticus]
MTVKVIQGIKPFNHFFYKSCFYNALFPVLEWMNRSIYPHITNDIILYNQNIQTPGMLEMVYHNFRDPEQIFVEENYKINTCHRKDDIVNELIQAINLNNPVIIWLDCYFENIRSDMYLNEHWAHTILIIGYNDATQQFAIMEHLNKDSLNYELKWISFDSLKQAYNGFFDLKHSEENPISYYEFFYQSEDENYSWVGRFEDNIINHQHLYEKGIIQLEQYSRWLKDVCRDPDHLVQFIEPIFSSLNQIVTAKQVECARYFYFDQNQERLQLIGNLLEEWKSIRIIWGKYYFSSVYSYDRISISIDGINRILEMEKKLVCINERKPIL